MSPLTTKDVTRAIESSRFAALVRSEHDIATLGTWNVNLPRDMRLLVPIDVRALLVTQDGAVQAVPTATVIPTSHEGDPVDAVLPVPPPLFGLPANRAAGVHLHWAMPDGLTRGDAGATRATAVPAGNPTALPPLPDRWVVVRMNHGTSTTRSWVIESDRADHHDLAGWSEPGATAPGMLAGASGQRVIPGEQLTAVAGGELAWAATYDAVVDRFAFHDDLADIATASRDGLVLSYMVAGWWSNTEVDPLAGCFTVGAYHERAKWLGWLAPYPTGLSDGARTQAANSNRGGAFVPQPPPMSQKDLSVGGPGAVTQDHGTVRLPDGPSMPTLTLLHGTVRGVTLAGGPDLAPAAEAIDVAVGPSGFGALGALLADGTHDARAASERVLAAFSSGLLATIDTPNGLVAVDDDRHAAGFVGFSGGQRTRPDRVAEGDVMGQPPGLSTVVSDARTRTASANAGGAASAGQATSGAGRTLFTPTVTLASKSTHDVLQSAYAQRFRTETAGPTVGGRTFRDVAVPAPRTFVPGDLAFVLRGGTRSFRHGGDGRFTPEGLLACRLVSQVVSGYAGVIDGGELPVGLRSLSSGAIPSEIDVLLREAVLADPYRWHEIVTWSVAARNLAEAQVTARIKAEFALREATSNVDQRSSEYLAGKDALRQASLAVGDDVSPVGVTRWAQPWVPLWCDWEIALAVDDDLTRWSLAEVDLTPLGGTAPDATASRLVAGRTLLTSASSRALAAQIRQWLSDEDARDQSGTGQIDADTEASLASAAADADGLDVLAGTFRGIRETLLGLDPIDAQRARIDAAGNATTKPTAHSLPMLLAGGAATITRLRLVDAFGRWRDIPNPRLALTEIASTITHPLGAPHLLLAPRVQRPARLAFRFIDPDTADGRPDVEARVDQQHPDRMVSPVAGWLLPDHVDESLECFDSAGNPLGQLMHDEFTGNVVWEGAPGRAGPIGGAPDPGSDTGARHLTRFAAGLVAADAAARNASGAPRPESALSALLRAIDTTLWTVDPLGSIGTGAVAGLVGRPIAIVRALLRLDVLDDLLELQFADADARSARAQAFAALAAREITTRLGTLTRTDDGLLAYAVNDDYSQMRLVAPEVRSQARQGGRGVGQLGVFGPGSAAAPGVDPLVHPYVGGPTDVGLRSGQTVHLTLLMMPGARVHATTGVLPRKSLALARDWFADALQRLSPSFRVGPVLVDPTSIRLPMITGLGDRQTFTRRTSPLTWLDDPITAATQSAYLPEQPSVLQEGWIRVVPSTERPDSGNTP